ncbi:Uncharacterised protein [Escherichia coli]|uniref:Uncharacterized protein n=1 Tax=Escherichia coli TaxID=562 RepID=A0A376W709_ECOLX|nr:Uncharacterised protein [Escherichia coli]
MPLKWIILRSLKMWQRETINTLADGERIADAEPMEQPRVHA